MSNTASGLRTIADLHDLSEFIPDPATAGFPEDFAELFARTESRLLRSTFLRSTFLRSTLEDEELVVVFRNKDLRDLARSPAAGMLVEYPHLQRYFRNLVFATNPPIHGPMRQVIARPLSPRCISHLEWIAKQIAAELVNEVAWQGEIDFCSQFSERFTARFWGTLFEMTDEEIDRVTDTVRAIAPILLLSHTPEETAAISSAMDAYLELVANAIDRSLGRGGNELLESMASAFNVVETKTNGFGEMIAANVLDGFHTVSVAGANALYQLLLSHDHLMEVRTDLSLVSNVITEGLRLWTPLIFTPRCALNDLEFAGTLIPHGTVLAMLWAAGNRDPEVFEHPNRYDLFRAQRDDATFGGGVHICPGRHVGRMLIRVMLEAVLASDIRVELTGNRPTWLPRSSARQLNRMQVTIRRIQP